MHNLFLFNFKTGIRILKLLVCWGMIVNNVLVLWRIVKVGLAWRDHTHLNTLLCIVWLQFLSTGIGLIIYLICRQKLVISLLNFVPLELIINSHWVILGGAFLIFVDLTLVNRFNVKYYSLLTLHLIFLQSLRSLFETKLGLFLTIRLALLLLQLQPVKHIVFICWAGLLGLFLRRTVMLTISFAIDRYSCPLMTFVKGSINLAKPFFKSVKFIMLIVFVVLHLRNYQILLVGLKRRNLSVSLFSMILMHGARLVNRVNSFWILEYHRVFLWIFWRLCEIVWRLDRNLLVKSVVLFFPWKLWKSNFDQISIVDISPMISKSSCSCHRFCSFGLS